MAKDLWEQTGEVGPDANDLACIPLASLPIFWAHFSCSNYFALLLSGAHFPQQTPLQAPLINLSKVPPPHWRELPSLFRFPIFSAEQGKEGRESHHRREQNVITLSKQSQDFQGW